MGICGQAGSLPFIISFDGDCVVRLLLDPPVYCTDCGGRISTEIVGGARRWYCDESQVIYPAFLALTLRHMVESHDAHPEAAIHLKRGVPPFCPQCAATLEGSNPWESGYVCPACGLPVTALIVGMVTRWAIHPLSSLQ